MVPRRKNRLSALRLGVWFSWRELKGRKMAFLINTALIAMLLAIAVSAESLGHARKGSVDKRIDYMGPSLSLVPGGVSSSDLVRAQMGDMAFSQETYSVLSNDLGDDIRGAEVRLISRLMLSGRHVPVVGIDPENMYSYPFSLYGLNSSDALIGGVLAGKLALSRNDHIVIGGIRFRIEGIIPATGGVDDLSVFIPLEVLQGITGKEGLVNEIRIFPSSAAAHDRISSGVKRYYEHLNVIDSFRGEVAEREMGSTLGGYQRVIFGVAFVMVAFCVLIGTYINIEGRKGEVSTIFTLGATKGVVFQVLTYRTVWIALAGSVLGHLISIAFISLYVNGLSYWSWESFFYVTLITVVLGLAVTLPFTYHSVYRRDLVAHL